MVQQLFSPWLPNRNVVIEMKMLDFGTDKHFLFTEIYKAGRYTSYCLGLDKAERFKYVYIMLILLL